MTSRYLITHRRDAAWAGVLALVVVAGALIPSNDHYLSAPIQI